MNPNPMVINRCFRALNPLRFQFWFLRWIFVVISSKQPFKLSSSLEILWTSTSRWPFNLPSSLAILSFGLFSRCFTVQRILSQKIASRQLNKILKSKHGLIWHNKWTIKSCNFFPSFQFICPKMCLQIFRDKAA